jgi:hypothetical protein
MLRVIAIFVGTAIAALPGIFFFIGLFWLGTLNNSMPILMYRGLVIACVACIPQACLLWCLLRNFPGREYILLAATSLAFAANVIFLVVFPVTIDRSVSIYLLGQLSRASLGMTESELNERVINQYIREYKGVARRMQEQMLSGNVEISGDRYRLTRQGEAFIRVSDGIVELFGVDPRYIRASAGNGQNYVYD